MEGSGRRSVVELYGRGAAGCRRRDTSVVRGVIAELVFRLDFDFDRAARELGRLYQLSLRHVEAGRFQMALEIFQALGATAAAGEPPLPLRPS